MVELHMVTHAPMPDELRYACGYCKAIRGEPCKRINGSRESHPERVAEWLMQRARDGKTSLATYTLWTAVRGVVDELPETRRLEWDLKYDTELRELCARTCRDRETPD